jgi:hypothetical protein
MARLNQILAIEKGAKTRAQRVLTQAHQSLLKPAMLEGIARTYRSLADDGEQFPPESKRVQLKAVDAIAEVAAELTRLFDVTATKEAANQEANADVIVDGEPLITDVPVTYLLFLEKQLVDIRTFIEKLPTLDPTQEWDIDPAQGLYATPPVETAKTRKVPRNHVLAAATDKHPAQVEVWHEDVVVGYWSRKLYSGALPAGRVEELLKRVIKLQDAVKVAREEANVRDVEDTHYGKNVFDYLFA